MVDRCSDKLNEQFNVLLSKLIEKRIFKQFSEFDLNKDGILTLEELTTVCDGDEEEAKAVIEKPDLNKDGKVDLDELKKAISTDGAYDLLIHSHSCALSMKISRIHQLTDEG